MSLHPEASYPIPEDTQRVARAAFRRGNPYMQVADRLGTIYHDAQFTALFGPDMRVDIARADSLPRTASGKFRYVESRVAQPILERLMGAASNQGASST